MSRGRAFVAGLAVLAAACPSQPRRHGDPPAGPTVTASSRPALDIPVVASETGSDAQTDLGMLDGMKLAAEDVNAAGGVLGNTLALEVTDDGGDGDHARFAFRDALDAGAPAVLVLDDTEAVGRSRDEIEAAGVPVLMLKGDLYSTRALFRWVFQVTPPLLWQARVIARYLAVDRGYRRVLLAIDCDEPEGVEKTALEAAAEEEGLRRLEPVCVRDEPRLRRAVGKADAVVYLDSSAGAARLSSLLGGLPDAPQLAMAGTGLSPEVAAAPGTVAAHPYTWAGWAEPIQRVHDFRERFRARFGRLPNGFEQEGYDAVRLLAEALTGSGGRSGEPLIGALESFEEQTYSGLPIRLGPDDHVLIDESQLGLFAADAPAPGEPWVEDPPYWRPLMRTFTYDGEKTNVLDVDKQVFFPSWKAPRPSPKYHRSRYGITTRYGKDPLH